MMASMITAGESSSQKSQWKYDVFLSFRGKDTRAGFTDHLYNALKQKGIYAYRDDPSLEKGRNISELLGAIEDSKCLIVIISANYASSTWCLEELAKIVECTEGGEQIAIPIFYNVEPSDVRKQGGSFQSAFLKHEADFKDDMDMVQRWRSAMTKIANRSGRNSRERFARLSSPSAIYPAQAFCLVRECTNLEMKLCQSCHLPLVTLKLDARSEGYHRKCCVAFDNQ